ncbi:ABC transporter substrate-binding protein [Phenylobacterium sp. J426]|uniref:ABC transporter substrate-binding protein n=1 Tax=Phenylobacterium sp. J426 TaxID=2898439 RepID=UPI0021517B49|nr:ABC transporter substrate-binding protein [Phenylobacterium sp. J426]MCR5875485.1 ABC transporter substrate-binding protein [Phenylobacterium sp. J426]
MLSLDSCADQYVMGLAARADIVGLSTRADDADSRLRHLARGLPMRRVDLESALAARPDVVVRYWGGEPRLIAALERRGVQVITIPDATDFDDIRRSVRRVAAALERRPQGEAAIAGMDARLARAAAPWKGARALYMTPGGVTAGQGTLIDAVLRAAGMTNAEARPGFQTISLEDLALAPPQAVVLGFFDTFQLSGDSWGVGRHRVLQRTARTRQVASLPGALLGCPDWGAAEAASLLAAKAPP